ncbi:MAG: biotin transporter BioY [Bacillota bacterium]|nr:biotin transporter BioY [Bacillota bacterium]
MNKTEEQITKQKETFRYGQTVNARVITFTSMFAALTAILSQLTFPLPFSPVPISLALISPIIAGMAAGWKAGATSQVVYLLLGTAGLPVFAGMKGGLSVLAGPTGGYIVGYVLCAFATGMVVKIAGKKIWSYIIAGFAGVAVCYAAGTAWFIFQTGNTLVAAMTMCVIPFLPGDCFKIALAVFVAVSLQKRKIKVL